MKTQSDHKLQILIELLINVCSMGSPLIYIDQPRAVVEISESKDIFWNQQYWRLEYATNRPGGLMVSTEEVFAKKIGPGTHLNQLV